MGQALERIETPPVLPKGVTRRQWRLAKLLPRCETAYEALIKAGYSHETARGLPGRISGAIGTQRASEAIAKAKRDSAREIKVESAATVLTEVKRKDADPSFALAAWLGSCKVVAEYPDEEQGTYDDSGARDYIRRVVTFAFQAVAYRNGYDNMNVAMPLSLQEIDAIALAAENAELTEYRLSDATPQPPEGSAAETAR